MVYKDFEKKRLLHNLLQFPFLDGQFDLPRNPPACGHGLIVFQPSIRRTIHIRVGAGHNPRGNLEADNLSVGGDDAFQAEGPEQTGRAELLALLNYCPPHLEDLRQKAFTQHERDVAHNDIARVDFRQRNLISCRNPA